MDGRVAAAIFSAGGFVVQQHTRAIGRNATILREFDVPVLVTYRNLFDSVLSFKESTRKDAEAGKGGKYTFLPLIIPDWTDWTESEVESWLVNNVAPWFILFLRSWLDADVEKKFFRYDEYYRDQIKSLREVLAFLGVDPMAYPENLLRGITETKRSKFNVGKSGRGRELLLPETQVAIRNQVASWKDERLEVLLGEK